MQNNNQMDNVELKQLRSELQALRSQVAKLTDLVIDAVARLQTKRGELEERSELEHRTQMQRIAREQASEYLSQHSQPASPPPIVITPPLKSPSAEPAPQPNRYDPPGTFSRRGYEPPSC